MGFLDQKHDVCAGRKFAAVQEPTVSLNLAGRSQHVKHGGALCQWHPSDDHVIPPWGRSACRGGPGHRDGAAGQTGVLPILDADPSDLPRWFVMPRARMIIDVLGTS